MNDVGREVLRAARRLRRDPRSTLAAVLILAIGLGASLTVFAWFRSLVLRPYPGVPGGGELLVVSGRTEQGQVMGLSAPDARDLAREAAGMAAIAATDLQAMSLLSGQVPERIWGGLVTGNFFEVLGLRPAQGRFFLPEEDAAGTAPAVVVLSHGFFTRRLGGDPALVGQGVILNGEPFTVVGVAPPDFQGTEVGLALDVWVPLAQAPRVVPGRDRVSARGDHWLRGLARLAPGASRQAAQARLDALAARLADEHPGTNRGKTFAIETLAASPWGASQFLVPVLAVLGGMVGLVLAVACANVANLQLARGLARRREVAVRLALGAGRGRLLGEAAREGLLLAGAGAVGGIAVAQWGKGLLVALMPPVGVPVAPNLELGLAGLAAAAVLALLAGLACSVAPALAASRLPLEAVLRDESSAVGGGAGRSRLRAALVIAQVALGCVLLASGLLFLRAAGAARRLGPGFRPAGQLVAALALFPNGYDEERGRQFQRHLVERLEALPGVERAAIGRRLPLDLGGTSSMFLVIEDYEPAPGEEVLVGLNQVSPGYFATLGIPLLAGRDFTGADRSGAPRVAIVNETMARRYWPEGGALGGRFTAGGTVTVVGIARDSKFRDLAEAPQPFFYLPLDQAYRDDFFVHARVAGDPGAFAPQLREAIRRLDPVLPVFAVKTMEEHVQIAVFKQRLAAAVLTGFGAVALLLTGVGLYSVLAFSLDQRLRELGLRAALGATPGDLGRLVLRDGARLAAAGLALGLAAALAAGRLLASLLLGVSAADPLAFAGAAVLVLAAAIAAAFSPARRAARLEPMAALRYE